MIFSNFFYILHVYILMFREEHPGTDALSNFSVQLLVIMSPLEKKNQN